MDNFIELSNVTYKYKKGRTVFENFNISLNCQECTILTGKNGCGKTTLTKLMMGILKPQAGNITIFKKNILDLSLGQIGEMIGYVFQYPERQLFATSVIDELTFPLLLKGLPKDEVYNRAQDMMDIFHLEKIKDSYPFFLSYGEKRRLAIASVLMNNPKYIILDEPTSSLDQERIDILSKVLNQLKEEKSGILIISHNEDFINRHADRRIQLEEGEVIRDVKY